MFHLNVKAPFEFLENVNLSGITQVNDAVCNTALSNRQLKILRVSNCSVTASLLDYVSIAENMLYLLEINRTNIPDVKIEEVVKKRAPHLRVIKACSVFWNMNDKGLRHPLVSMHVVKPLAKGAKQAKKVDDKNPEVAFAKFEKENQPVLAIKYQKI